MLAVDLLYKQVVTRSDSSHYGSLVEVWCCSRAHFYGLNLNTVM